MELEPPVLRNVFLKFVIWSLMLVCVACLHSRIVLARIRESIFIWWILIDCWIMNSVSIPDDKPIILVGVDLDIGLIIIAPQILLIDGFFGFP